MMKHLDVVATALKAANGVSKIVRNEKSVRVTIGGKTYDLFCRFVPTINLCGELRNAFADIFKRRKSRKSDKIESVRRSKVFVRHHTGYKSMWIGSTAYAQGHRLFHIAQFGEESQGFPVKAA